MKLFIFVALVLDIVLEVVLLESSRIGYDLGYNHGLEDWIRMTNEVISEEVRS